MLGLTAYLIDDCCQGACGSLSPCVPEGVERVAVPARCRNYPYTE